MVEDDIVHVVGLWHALREDQDGNVTVEGRGVVVGVAEDGRDSNPQTTLFAQRLAAVVPVHLNEESGRLVGDGEDNLDCV